MSDHLKTLRDLVELQGKARNAGQWLLRYGGGPESEDGLLRHLEIRRGGECYSDEVIHAVDGYVKMSEDDGVYIVAAANADLPGILARMEALEAALESAAKHHEDAARFLETKASEVSDSPYEVYAAYHAERARVLRAALETKDANRTQA